MMDVPHTRSAVEHTSGAEENAHKKTSGPVIPLSGAPEVWNGFNKGGPSDVMSHDQRDRPLISHTQSGQPGSAVCASTSMFPHNLWFLFRLYEKKKWFNCWETRDSPPGLVTNRHRCCLCSVMSLNVNNYS